MRRVAAGLLVAALLAGCSSEPAAARRNAVTVGAVLALSGDDAALGLSQQRGLELALNRLRGPKVHLAYRDEAGSATAGTTAVRRFVREGVDVVIGPTHSNVARAAYGEADVEEVPMLGISMTVPGLTAFRPFLWRTSLAGDRVTPPAVRDAVRRLSPRSAVIVGTGNDLLTRAEAELFRDTLAETGVSLLAELTYPKGQRDVSLLVDEIRRQGPDLVAIAALTGDGGRLLHGLRAAGVQAAVVGGNGFNSAAILGPEAEGLTVGSAWSIDDPSPMSRAFVADYRSTYRTPPDQFAAQAYAGMQVLFAAIRAGDATRAGIQRGLGHIGTINTVIGRFRFDQSRDASHRPWIRVVTNGAFVATRP
jgi:branched-chain amino acid transport system substrate-binding protein